MSSDKREARQRFSRTFLVGRDETLGPPIRRRYLMALLTLGGIHLAGIGTVVILTLNRDKTVSPDALTYLFTVLQGVGLLSGLVIIALSLRSEALISQTYELARAMSQATSHEFESFQKHLEHVKAHLSPVRYPRAKTLCISVSTPIYGIGDTAKSAEAYLDFLESWVEHFETSCIENATEPPTWDLAIWERDANLATFVPDPVAWARDAGKLRLIERCATLLDRAYMLHKARKVELSLFLTPQSHARLFMVREHLQRQGGLVVLFSPLTPMTVKSRTWSLLGFGFYTEEAYENIARFNHKLQCTDPDLPRPTNHVEVLKSARPWLFHYYNVPVPKAA